MVSLTLAPTLPWLSEMTGAWMLSENSLLNNGGPDHCYQRYSLIAGPRS